MLGLRWFFGWVFHLISHFPVGFSYDYPLAARHRQLSSARRRWSSYDASRTRRTRRPWRCRQQRWWPPLRCDTLVETGGKMAWLGSRIRLFYLKSFFFEVFWLICCLLKKQSWVSFVGWWFLVEICRDLPFKTGDFTWFDQHRGFLVHLWWRSWQA